MFVQIKLTRPKQQQQISSTRWTLLKQIHKVPFPLLGFARTNLSTSASSFVWRATKMLIKQCRFKCVSCTCFCQMPTQVPNMLHFLQNMNIFLAQAKSILVKSRVRICHFKWWWFTIMTKTMFKIGTWFV